MEGINYFIVVKEHWSKFEVPFVLSRHRCISDASLRRLIQRLRDISKGADLQISETSTGRLIKDVCSDSSLRSLRFSQRRLSVPSETVIIGLQTKAYFWLPVHLPTNLYIFC